MFRLFRKKKRLPYSLKEENGIYKLYEEKTNKLITWSQNPIDILNYLKENGGRCDE